MLKKEFHDAINVCNIVEKLDSSLISKFRLGEIYYYMGHLDESKAVFQQFNLAPLELKTAALLYLGMISSQRGEKEKVLEIIDDIRLISPQEFVLFDYFRLASIYMGLGMKKLGYENLRSFFNKSPTKKMRFIWIKYIEIDRNFENFKKEEEFIKIIKNNGGIHG